MYNIAQLTAFNHALVYEFEPESSDERLLRGSEALKDMLYPEIGQHLDILNAYLYAQDVILPKIQIIGIANITAPMLIDWILELHKRLGKSLLKCKNVESGQYVQGEVARWQQGWVSALPIGELVNKVARFDSRAKNFTQEYARNNHLDIETCKIFVGIIKSIREQIIKNIKNLNKHIDENGNIDNLMPMVVSKLMELCRQDQLTDKEKAAIDQIVKFPMHHSKIPAAMEAYAQDILHRWQQCIDSSQQEISIHLAEIFAKFTDIHPFANGNGRTATCLINIMLKSLGLPDILLRTIGDQENINSSYSQAIAKIDNDRSLLAKHIYQCIESAKVKPYTNPKQARIIELRAAFYYKCLELENYKYKIDKFYIKTRNRIYNEVPPATLLGPNKEVAALEYMVYKFNTKAEKVKLKNKSNLTFFAKNQALTIYNNAVDAFKAKDYKSAIQMLEQALVMFKEKCGEISFEVANCYSTLASCQRELGLITEALASCDLALNACENNPKQKATILTKREKIAVLVNNNSLAKAI